MFFLEGPKVLFKVALAVLNLCFSTPKSQKDISSFFELTRKLRNLPIEVTHEETLIQEVREWGCVQGGGAGVIVEFLIGSIIKFMVSQWFGFWALDP